ncbi:tetratricopeptide repeat protein [Nocardioides pakistanensis]
MERDAGAAIEAGPGWHIDARTLQPVIDDLEVFTSAHQDDPALEALTLLWTGRPNDAEAAIRQAMPRGDSLRFRALLADTWRDQGRTDDAVEAYQQLVRETAGTASEAVMRQHLGKAQFAAGRYRDARMSFEQALELRVAAGAERALVQSSRAAAARAAEAERTGR